MKFSIHLFQKVPHVPRKEGSNVRPKITVLDKAIRELEKIVAECIYEPYRNGSFLSVYAIYYAIIAYFFLCVLKLQLDHLQRRYRILIVLLRESKEDYHLK